MDKRSIKEIDKYACEGARRLAAFKLLLRLATPTTQE
jgi:hypothetical protein